MREIVKRETIETSITVLSSAVGAGWPFLRESVMDLG